MSHKRISKAKAKKILRHGEVRGHPLTKKQKGFFGARAGGVPMIDKSHNTPAVVHLLEKQQKAQKQ